VTTEVQTIFPYPFEACSLIDVKAANVQMMIVF